MLAISSKTGISLFLLLDGHLTVSVGTVGENARAEMICLFSFTTQQQVKKKWKYTIICSYATTQFCLYLFKYSPEESDRGAALKSGNALQVARWHSNIFSDS